MTPTVREATLEDIPQIIQCGRRFYEHAKLKQGGLSFDPESFGKFAGWIIGSPAGCLFVACLDGVVVGSIAGLMAPWILNQSQRVASEQWWWIEPEHRKGFAAKRLLTAFEKWSRDNGATHCMMMHLKNDSSTRISRFYGLMGYSEVETHYIKGF